MFYSKRWREREAGSIKYYNPENSKWRGVLKQNERKILDCQTRNLKKTVIIDKEGGKIEGKEFKTNIIIWSVRWWGERTTEPMTLSSAMEMRVNQYHGQLSGHWPDGCFLLLMEISLFLGQHFCSSLGFWLELRSSSVVLEMITIKKYTEHTPASLFYISIAFWLSLIFSSDLYLASSYFLSIPYSFLLFTHSLFSLSPPVGSSLLQKPSNSWWCSPEWAQNNLVRRRPWYRLIPLPTPSLIISCLWYDAAK